MAAPVRQSPWFDRLARAAAGGMSRRDAIGLVARGGLLATLGSWFRPMRAFAAGPRQAQDPGCGGIRTFYRAGCAKPVPKLNHKPPVNGCGPQNGFNPVPQTPLNMATFTPACDEHDRGYGTCNKSKDETDLTFLADMLGICASTYPVTGFLSSLSYLQCGRNAEIYYNAVNKLGDDPYKEGQEAGCDCCDECPGGAAKCGDKGICCPKGKVCDLGACCEPCSPGWIRCPVETPYACKYGCCNPATPVCCPGLRPGSIRCCKQCGGKGVCAG